MSDLSPLSRQSGLYVLAASISPFDPERTLGLFGHEAARALFLARRSLGKC
jgi:hypothetical protein